MLDEFASAAAPSFKAGGVAVSILSSWSAADGEPTGVNMGDFSNSLPWKSAIPSNFSRAGFEIVGPCKTSHIQSVRQMQWLERVVIGSRNCSTL